jgi:uncharacterized RDD family membrane protein YckC
MPRKLCWAFSGGNMFCSQCGTERQFEARFCHKCGFAFLEQTAQPTARIEPHISEARAETPPTAKSEPLIAKPHISEARDESNKFLGGIYHPWRRFFARCLDIYTLGLLSLLLVVLVASILFPSKAPVFAKIFDNQIIASFIIAIWWIPLEAFLLSTAGNTPAKWLFGISIKTTDGNNLSFEAALQRSFLVVLQGMAFGIPIVALFTHIFAYRRLTNTGTTLWDTTANSVVSHKTWGAGRAIICVVAVLVTYTFLAALTVMGA